MHYELLFPSLYVKAADLRGKDVTLTIRKITVEKLNRMGTSKKEPRPIVYFQETARKAEREGVDEKRLVLNKTNARTIADLYGNETDDWIGQKITLYGTEVQFGRGRVEAIRIRPKASPSRSSADTTSLVDGPDMIEENAPKTIYDLNARCSKCGQGYSDGAPVNKQTGTCDECESGHEDANMMAMDAIQLGDADTTE